MVPAVPKPEIVQVFQISAQLEQLCERYSKFNWFLKIACFRYVGPWGQDCVSGVHPCLAHSQNLSELIGHFNGGQNPYRTAVHPSSRGFLERLCRLHLFNRGYHIFLFEMLDRTADIATADDLALET